MCFAIEIKTFTIELQHIEINASSSASTRRVPTDRVKSGVDEMIRQEQAGFRSGRRTSEQIFALRNILEKCQEWQSPVDINFVDLSKAFDYIIRERLWDIMGQYGIPEIFIRTFKAPYHRAQAVLQKAEGILAGLK